MKYLLLLFCLSQLGFISTVTASAITNQFGDKIIYEGKEYTISEYLMESYFEKYPEKKPELQVSSSALYRGYIATYQFFENQLYVIDIEIYVRQNGDYTIASVFKEVFPNKKRKRVDWKSGFLVIPNGKLVNLAGELYSNYLVLEVKRGKLKEARDYTKDELHLFKERQFNKFKCTRKYKLLVKTFQANRNPKMEEKQLHYIFQMKVLEHSKKFLVA